MMLTTEKPAISVGGLLLFPDHADDGTWYYAAPNPTWRRPAAGRCSTFRLHRRPEAVTTRRHDHPGRARRRLPHHGHVLCAGHRQQGDRSDHARDPAGPGSGPVEPVADPLHEGHGQRPRPRCRHRDAAPTGGRPPRRPAGFRGTDHRRRPAVAARRPAVHILAVAQPGRRDLPARPVRRGAAPVGVVYDLKFLALRPSVQATVHANVSKIYTEFGGKTGAGLRLLPGRRGGHAAEAAAERRHRRPSHLGSGRRRGESRAGASDVALRDKIIQELFNQPQHPTCPSSPCRECRPSSRRRSPGSH